MIIVKNPMVETITTTGKDWIFIFKFCCNEVVKLLVNSGANKIDNAIAANQYQNERKSFLRANKLPKQKTEEYYWQEVDLKPVVVIRDKEYWITIGVEYGNILLPTASEKQCAFRVRKNVKWATPDVANFGIILMFHGRVMPIAYWTLL